MLTIGSDAQVLSFLQADATVEAPQFSPDGSWVVYASTETSRSEIYVQSFPSGGNKRQISTEGGTEPLWSPDGTEIFYRNGHQMMVAAVEPGEVLSAAPPELLFEGHYERLPRNERNYDVTSDGRRFLMVKSQENEQQLIAILDWFEELKARVPTN